MSRAGAHTPGAGFQKEKNVNPCKVCQMPREEGYMLACDFCDAEIHRDCAGIVGGYHSCGDCHEDAKEQVRYDHRDRDEFEREHRPGST